MYTDLFTGCDVVSAFHDKGEKNAWQTYNVWPEASTVFRNPSQYSPVHGEDDQSILEKFVVIMYDMFSATDSIDEVRLDMFSRKQVIWFTPTPQCKQLLFNILIISVLHTNQYAYGDKKLLYVKWKPNALHTVVGRSKMTCGKCFGQYFRQLLRVAKSLRSVAAGLNAVPGASNLALVFLA